MMIFQNTNADLITKVINCFAAVEVTPMTDGIRRAFIACPGSALPLSRIAPMVEAINGVELYGEDELRKALASLVRQGALRSYILNRETGRVWEVNY